MIRKVAIGFGKMKIIVGLSNSTQKESAEIIYDFSVPIHKIQKSILTFEDFSCMLAAY